MKIKRNKVGEAPNYSNKEIKISRSDNWRTPQDLFLKLEKEFCFDLDAACDEDNCLCEYGITLKSSPDTKWFGNVFVNPPYSIPGLFYRKAREYVLGDSRAKVVMLVKVATSENYWKEAAKDMHVRFLHGRIKFWDETNTPRYGATFPSAILIFSPETLGNGKMELWSYKGEIPERIV